MTFPPSGYYDSLLSNIQLPRMASICVTYDNHRMENIAQAVRQELLACCGIETVHRKRVAVAVGSRGLANLPVLVKTTVDILREKGADVFIVPAMGSHGGATAEGQYHLLEHLGISERTMCVPIYSNMEPVVIAHTDEGIPVYFDANAADADYTVSITRVKPHTAFRGTYESGMVKMNVIGLGKQKGADYCHSQGMNHMAENLQKIGSVSIQQSNLLLSLCVLENFYDETYMIRAVPKKDILHVEPGLLAVAKTLMPTIPFQNLDVLIIDEIGKNITGAGMDPNIIQRFSSPHIHARPFTKQLVVLDLTEESDGNSNGAGFADVSTKRLYDKIDAEKAYTNSLTARVAIPAKLPIIMDNDFNAIKAGIKLAASNDFKHLRIVRIRNTLSLSRMEVSEALLEEAEAKDMIRVLSRPSNYHFDEQGNLPKEGFLYSYAIP